MDEDPPYTMAIQVYGNNGESLTELQVKHDHASTAFQAFGHAVDGALAFYKEKREKEDALRSAKAEQDRINT